MSTNQKETKPKRLRFFYFYLYFAIPMGTLKGITNFLIINTQHEYWLTIIIINIFLFIGLRGWRHWAFILNKVSIIIGIYIFAVTLLFGLHNMISSSAAAGTGAVGSSIVGIIESILILIYFEKRKHLFNSSTASTANSQNTNEKFAQSQIITAEPRIENAAQQTFDFNTGAISSAECKIIPPSSKIGIDENGLPYVKNRIYQAGWGKAFNAFVTTNGDCYHKSKCPLIKGKPRQVIHIYTAIQDENLRPCLYCNPKRHIDDWYIRQTGLKSPAKDSEPKTFEEALAAAKATKNQEENLERESNKIPLPELDFVDLWAESEDVIKERQKQYALDMAEYVKNQVKTDLAAGFSTKRNRFEKRFVRKSGIIIGVFCFLCIAIGFVSYQLGRSADRKAYRELYAYETNPKRIVFTTSTGVKYHDANCPIILNAKLSSKMSLEVAKSRGLTPCYKCNEFVEQ